MGTLFLQNEVPIMAKKKVRQDTVPLHHHLDKRAAHLLATSGDDDDLLTTPETAEWLQTSEQWLEIGRVKGYGPPFERLAPKIIRYRRGKVRKWLDQRSHFSTAEYRDELEPLEVGRG
jgi:hypothetical protein